MGKKKEIKKLKKQLNELAQLVVEHSKYDKKTRKKLKKMLTEAASVDDKKMKVDICKEPREFDDSKKKDTEGLVPFVIKKFFDDTQS